MVVRKFAPKIPVQVFAYLITKTLCLILILPELCNEKLLLIFLFSIQTVRVPGEFNGNCFAFNNKTSYNTDIIN